MRDIKKNDLIDAVPCQEGQVTRVPGLGKLHLLELNEKGTQVSQGKSWIQLNPLVCAHHRKEIETLLSKSKICKKPGDCEIKYAQGFWKCKTHNQNLNKTDVVSKNERLTKLHPNEVWENLPVTDNKQLIEDLKTEETWKEIWTLALLWPTSSIIPIILLEDEAWMPPYIPHENESEEHEVIILKYEEGTFKKLKHKTERITKSDGQSSTYKATWKTSELTEHMLRIIWGLWGPGIEKDRKNGKTWKPFKSQMKLLNLVPESVSKPTETERAALMEYLAEANNEKPEDWPTSLWGKHKRRHKDRE